MTAAPFAFEERPSQHSQWYPDGVGMQSEKAGVSLCPQSSPAAPRSPARQFKEATGLPPHQYVIARRVERAKQLLQGDGDLTLAQVAARTGFSDQSQFCLHFKRLVGVTPGQFRMPTRIE